MPKKPLDHLLTELKTSEESHGIGLKTLNDFFTDHYDEIENLIGKKEASEKREAIKLALQGHHEAMRSIHALEAARNKPDATLDALIPHLNKVSTNLATIVIPHLFKGTANPNISSTPENLEKLNALYSIYQKNLSNKDNHPKINARKISPLRINDDLITMVQRGPRYPLLFKEISKEINKEKPSIDEFGQLSEAMKNFNTEVGKAQKKDKDAGKPYEKVIKETETQQRNLKTAMDLEAAHYDKVPKIKITNIRDKTVPTKESIENLLIAAGYTADSIVSITSGKSSSTRLGIKNKEGKIIAQVYPTDTLLEKSITIKPYMDPEYFKPGYEGTYPSGQDVTNELANIADKLSHLGKIKSSNQKAFEKEMNFDVAFAAVKAQKTKQDQDALQGPQAPQVQQPPKVSEKVEKPRSQSAPEAKNFQDDIKTRLEVLTNAHTRARASGMSQSSSHLATPAYKEQAKRSASVPLAPAQQAPAPAVPNKMDNAEHATAFENGMQILYENVSKMNKLRNNPNRSVQEISELKKLEHKNVELAKQIYNNFIKEGAAQKVKIDYRIPSNSPNIANMSNILVQAYERYLEQKATITRGHSPRAAG